MNSRHPSRALHRSLTMLIISALALPAAELVVRDLQFEVTALPTAFSYDTTSSSVDRSGDDHFRSGTELALGGRRSFAAPGSAWGLLAGGDLFSQAWTYGSDGSLTCFGARLTLGTAWSVTDHWGLALEAGGSLGLSRIQLPRTTGGPAYDANGRQLGFDLRATAGWQISEHVVLDVHGGWLQTQFTGSEQAGVTTDLSLSGLTVGIGIAWRLSNAPERLR